MTPVGRDNSRRRIAVVTGSRAEFGLLRPVMLAAARRDDLELCVVVAGSHLVGTAPTYHEVKREFPIAAAVPMQSPGRTGREADVEAVGTGVGRFGRAFASLAPDWVVVLGDRIEAFAAAAAASIGGYALAHIHGGDRAEGIADEAMRHAITKLAHLHLAATRASAERIVRMGEDPASVHIVGSPALDDLPACTALDDAAWADLGSPTAVFLMHPVGRSVEDERHASAEVLAGLSGERVLAFNPNFDAGREGIVRAIEAAGVRRVEHMPRAAFVGMLRRLADSGGVLVGNSSAGLIEAAALRVPVVDVGMRQAGRERCANVVHVAEESAESVRDALMSARRLDLRGLVHPYGDGRAGERIAAILATHRTVPGHRKRCAY